MGHTKAMNVLRELGAQTAAADRSPVFPRRRFLKIMGAGAGTVVALSGWLVRNAGAQTAPSYSMVAVDLNSCTGCGSCARVCAEQRVGAILINDVTGKPEGICDLCEGDPVCVKKCPFGALTYMKDSIDGRSYADAPAKLAEELIAQWYFHR